MEDDEELIERARGGCGDSFQALIERHGPPVYRALLRMTGGRVHDAEDLYQETLLKVARGMRDYRHQGTFRAWVFRVARNQLLDERKRRRLPEAPMPEAVPADQDVEERLRTQGLEKDLGEAVERLTPKLREVFMLRHHGGLTYREIAAVLAAPLGTVLARMSYAVQALRPRLEDWRRRERPLSQATAPRRGPPRPRETP